MQTLYLAAFLAILPFSLLAQSASHPDSSSSIPQDWYHLDPYLDGKPGTSTNRAYEELLKNRVGKKVVVAVIDSGVDPNHEDLRSVMWINKDEIAGNNIDDDKNGYIDDLHGWNFLGNESGVNLIHDTYEITRLYSELLQKHEVDKLNRKEKKKFEAIKDDFNAKLDELKQQQANITYFAREYERAHQLFTAYLNTDVVNASLIKSIDSPDDKLTRLKNLWLYAHEKGLNLEKFNELKRHFHEQLSYNFNVKNNQRDSIIGKVKPGQRFYGNNDVQGNDAVHGSHVAGIIAAKRNNGLGIDGITDQVKIMALRVVPNGDERDIDVANAIYYAVDNGARIINMSFGKTYSPNRKLVQEAISYAQEAGVLMVHAAGNEGKDLDDEENYPNRYYSRNKAVANWIEVGASSWKSDQGLPAAFSNYGADEVDVFAPGVDIRSSVPGGYDTKSGTSMAAPVTTGIAALLLSYFPELTAEEVKDIILTSAFTYQSQRVNKPGNQSKTSFGKLSRTGSVVNTYAAVKMALQMQGNVLEVTEQQ